MAIPPQVVMMAIQLAQQRQQANQERFKNKVNEIPDIASGIGGVLEQVSIREDGSSNTGQAALAGALKGGSAGVSLGPLGIIGGALLGGASGFGSANQSNADFYDNKALNEAFNLSAKTVSPSIFGKGGSIDGDEFVAVQMELDENYVTPDLNIYDSKATKKHEDMENDEVTDVVIDDSFVFSNRKKFKASKHGDKTLGYGFAHYSEDGRFSLDKVKMSDVFGDSKKEIPFSEAAKRIRKSFKTIREDDKNVDLLTQITNQENKQARSPFVNQLIKIHEGGGSDIDPVIPQKFGKGGGVKKNKVKKYYDGSTVNLETQGGYSYVNENGDLVSVDENGNESIIQEFDTVNSSFEDLGLQLEKLQQDNLQNFNTTNRNTSDLFGRLNTRNGLASVLQGLTVGLQSTRVDPKLQDARFVDGSFEEISPATADQISSEGIGRVNSLIANIAKTSTGAAERAAPRLFDSALRQSNSSRLNILNNNLAQRRNKYKFLNKLGNANRSERIRADEETRNLINKKRTNLANVGIGFLQNRDRLDVNKFQLDRSALSETNDNQLSLFQNGLNLAGMRSQYGLNRDYIDLQNRQFEAATNGGRKVQPLEKLPTLPPKPLEMTDDQYLEILQSMMSSQPIYDLPIGTLS